jgi:hypothetical protein
VGTAIGGINAVLIVPGKVILVITVTEVFPNYAGELVKLHFTGIDLRTGSAAKENPLRPGIDRQADLQSGVPIVYFDACTAIRGRLAIVDEISAFDARVGAHRR